MKKEILLVVMLILFILVSGCNKEPPQNAGDLTAGELAEVNFPTEEKALAGEAVKWTNCIDSDSKITYDKNSLSVVGTTSYAGGKFTDQCYTWYKGTAKEKTRLIEGTCSNGKFIYWYADCNVLGAGYKCNNEISSGGMGGQGQKGSCTPSKTCVDEDNGDIYTQAAISGYALNGDSVIDYDKCASYDTKILLEQSCEAGQPYVKTQEVNCEFGCLNGKCLKQGEQLPECSELIPNHNSESENRINLVFVGHHYNNINDLKEKAEKFVDYVGEGTFFEIPAYEGNLNEPVIYGLLGIEPYKSNKQKFNLWYVGQIYNGIKSDESCPSYATNLEQVCPNENQYVINLCNYHTQTAGISGTDISVSTLDETGQFDVPSIGLINHELGGHSLGDLKDVAYPQLYGMSGYPNLAGNIQEAQEWWGNMVGNGCGDDVVVDCLEDCYAKGECQAGEYQTEVQYVAVKPEDCFIGGNFINSCSLDLERRESVPGGIKNKHIAFRAMSKNSCQNSQDNCMYYDEGNIFCFDKKIPREDECSSLVDKNIYPELPQHDSVVGSKFKPHLYSIMKGPSSPKFGQVNEKEICVKLKEKLGIIGGYCSSEFGIS